MATTDTLYRGLYTPELHATLTDLGCTGRIERIEDKAGRVMVIVAERPDQLGLVFGMVTDDGNSILLGIPDRMGTHVMEALANCTALPALMMAVTRATEGWTPAPAVDA